MSIKCDIKNNEFNKKIKSLIFDKLNFKTSSSILKKGINSLSKKFYKQNVEKDTINFTDFLRMLSLAASTSELPAKNKAILEKALDQIIKTNDLNQLNIINDRNVNLNNTQKFIPLFNIKLNKQALEYIKSALTKLAIWDGAKIITSIDDLNKTIYKFQNNLFKNVCEYVLNFSENKINKKFIAINSNSINYENYSDVMEAMNKILNNKYLNNMQIDLNLLNNGEELIPIINFYLLNNFDKIIKFLVSDIIKINNNENNLILDLEKYSLIDETFIQLTFNEDSMLDSTDFYTNKLLNKFLYSIEIKGENRFLSTNDLNQIYSAINRIIKEDIEIKITKPQEEGLFFILDNYKIIKPSSLLNNMLSKEEKFDILKNILQSSDFISIVGENISTSLIENLENYETAFNYSSKILTNTGDTLYGKDKKSSIFLYNKLDFITSFLNEISIHNSKAIEIINNESGTSDGMSVENINNKNKSLIRKKIFNAISNNIKNNKLDYYKSSYLYNGVSFLGDSKDVFSEDALLFFKDAYGIELSEKVKEDLNNSDSKFKDFIDTLLEINNIIFNSLYAVDDINLNQFGENLVDQDPILIIKNRLEKDLPMFGPYIGFTNLLVEENQNDAVKMLSTEGNQQPNFVMPNISNLHSRNKRILLETGNKIDSTYSEESSKNVFINDQGLNLHTKTNNSKYQVPLVQRLEVVTQEDPYLNIIEGNKLRTQEALQVSLNIEFLNNIIYKNTFLTQTVCPSDKPSINNCCINIETIKEKGLKNLDILNLTYIQNKQYFSLIQKDIINKYNKLFDLNLDVNNPKSLNTIILKLNNLDLKQFNKLVSNFLQKNPGYEFTEGVDYCTRKGKMFFNSELLYYLRLYNSENSTLNDYEKHLNIGFTKFLETLKNSDIPFVDLTNLKTIDSELKFLCDFEFSNAVLNSKFVNFIKENSNLTWSELLDNKEFSPYIETILKKYYYLSDLVRNADKQLTTKYSFIHDAKGDSLILNFKGIQTEEQLEELIVNNIDNYKDEGNNPDNLLAKEMSSRFKTSTKRENAYVATYTPYNTDSIWGCPKLSRLSIIPDITENLYNYIGDIINQDLQDGAILSSGIAAQWEMRSQFGKKLTESKKVIGFISRFNSLTQVKCADFPISNALLRMCWKDKQFDIFKLVKKMHSLALIENVNGEFKFNINPKTFENISKFNENEKFYKYINNQLYQFKSIGFKNNELVIEWLNIEDNSIIQDVVFDSSKKQFTVNDLWEKLGGYSTYSYDENHELVPDESSMIFLADLLSISDGYYGTKLKEQLISKAAWNTTVKEAATNRNSKNVLIDDLPLNYINFEYTSFGIQNDSTHLVDDSEMANPSQVETAIAFNGQDVERSKEVYKAISEIVKNGLDEIIEDFKLIEENETDTEEIKIKKRETFEKAMAKHLSRALESSADVSSAVSLIRKILNTDDNFSGKINLPISSPSLFNKIEQVLMSALNSGAIRLKQSGTASVINPSRGMIKMFEIGGVLLSKQDILNKIHDDDTYKDKKYINYNDHELIEDYLESHKDEFNKSNCNISDLNIADIIEINYNDLLSILDKFPNLLYLKDNLQIFGDNCRIEISNPMILKDIETLINSGCNIIKCNYLGRDIKPRTITWDIEIDGKIIHRNIWTHDIVLDLIKYKLDHEDNLEDPAIKKIYNLKLLKFRQLLKLLSKGLDFYNGKYYNTTNFNNKPGEQILGKVNRTKHHIGNATLYDIKNNPNYYDNIIELELKPIYSKAYKDISYVYGTTENYDIIFADKFDPSEKFEKLNIVERNGNYYAVDKSGNEVFPVSNKNINVYKTNNSENKNLFIIQADTKVLEYNIRIIKKQLNALYLNHDIFTYSENFEKSIKRFNTLNLSNDFPIDIKDNLLIDEQIKTISKNLYNSFLMCNECTSLRIPSQSYQSFMGMETVGFTEANTNDCYVNIWEIWFQGSDHDIDKAYTLMYTLNKLGHIEMFSPLAKLNSKKNIELSLDLPLPEKQSVILNVPNNKNDISLDTIIDKLFGKELLKSNDPKQIELLYGNLNNISLILKELNKLSKWGINVNNNNELLNPLVLRLNLHNNFKPSKEGYLNKVVRNIYTSSQDIKNLEYSVQPMSADSYRKITEQIEEERNIGENNLILNNTNPVDIFSVMENNAVGKGGVGIFANGVKVVGTIHLIYNEFYFNKHQLELLKKDPNYKNYFTDEKLKLNEKYQEFIKNEKYKKFSIGIGKKDTNNTYKEGLQFTIKGDPELIIKKDPITTLANIKTYGLESEVKSDETINPEDLTKLLSISNKKATEISEKIKLEENVADKISILISLATDNAKELMLARINSFEELSNGVIALTALGFSLKETLEISINLFKPIADQLHRNRLIKGYIKKDVIDIIDNINFDPKTKESLKTVFEFGKELTTLAMYYKINQGLKSKFSDIEQFKQRLNKHKDNLLKITKIKRESDVIKLLNLKPESESTARIVQYVLNPFNSYLFATNKEYQTVMKDLNNLAKTAINIFDCILESPHFNEMLKSFSIIQNKIQNKSIKALFVDYTMNPTSFRTKIFSEVSTSKKEIDSRKHIEKDNLNWMTSMVDHYVIDLFLQEQTQFEFKIKDILIFLNKIGIENNNFNKLDPNMSINLKSRFGIDLFMNLMTNYIIPYLKKTNPNNSFLNYLKEENMNRSDILVYNLNLDLFNISSKEDEHVVNNIKSDFLNLSKQLFDIKNTFNKAIYLGDIFYMYNLIAHKNSINNLSAISYLYDDVYHNSITNNFEAQLSNKYAEIDNLPEIEKIKICDKLYNLYLISRNSNKEGYNKNNLNQKISLKDSYLYTKPYVNIAYDINKDFEKVLNKKYVNLKIEIVC